MIIVSCFKVCLFNFVYGKQLFAFFEADFFFFVVVSHSLILHAKVRTWFFLLFGEKSDSEREKKKWKIEKITELLEMKLARA